MIMNHSIRVVWMGLLNEWSWSKESLTHTSVIFGIIQAAENKSKVNDALLGFLHLCLNVNTK